MLFRAQLGRVKKPWPQGLSGEEASDYAMKRFQDLPISANPLTCFYFCMTRKLNHENSCTHITFPPYVTVLKTNTCHTKQNQTHLILHIGQDEDLSGYYLRKMS